MRMHQRQRVFGSHQAAPSGGGGGATTEPGSSGELQLPAPAEAALEEPLLIGGLAGAQGRSPAPYIIAHNVLNIKSKPP